jgi:thiamine biosynthesis lipoprotein
MGTAWSVTLWNELSPQKLAHLEKEIVARSHAFEQTFSRFKDDSLVWKLSKTTGVCEVPTDLVAMLRVYRSLYTPSMHKLNPLIGHTISDLGYDKDYSLTPKAHIRSAPDFLETVKIVDGTHIELREHALMDLGALGKGYFVDRIAEYLREEGITEFLVNGSGDIAYERVEGVIRAGLEDPEDPTKVIGVMELSGKGAFCASSTLRRAWKGHHHTIDPTTGDSPKDIIATWVWAGSACLADALATCLFFIPEGNFRPAFDFECAVMKNGRSISASSGFRAQFF